MGLAACNGGSEGPVTTPPPEIDIGQSDDGGAEPSDGGGADGGSAEAAPDIPAPDPADYPGMDEETPEGAEQAFKYFWAVALWGHQTGESDDLATLGADECGSCGSMVEDIEDIKSSGSYWSSADLEDVSIEEDGSWEDYDSVVTYSFTIDEHVEPAADGGAATEVPKQGVTAVGALSWQDDSWLVVDLSVETSGISG
ncbi:MAG TPA: DUF6318 family protein [Brachybacterium sp.]